MLFTLYHVMLFENFLHKLYFIKFEFRCLNKANGMKVQAAKSILQNYLDAFTI